MDRVIDVHCTSGGDGLLMRRSQIELLLWTVAVSGVWLEPWLITWTTV